MSERVKAMLAKAAVKSPGIEPHIPGGRAPLINGLDVVGSASGCPVVGYYLCLAKYVGDPDSEKTTVDLLEQSLLWSNDNMTESEANGLSRFAVKVEVKLDTDRCPKCKRTGFVYVRGVAKVCQKCEGSGKVEFSERRLAKECGIDREVFRRKKYKSLFREVQAKLGEWETSALFIMDYKLFGEERVAV